MKNKSFLTILLTVILMFSLTGCGNSFHKDVKVLLSVSHTKDTFINSLADAAKQAAQKEDIQLTVVSADKSIDKQVSQVKQAVSDHYDVIMCLPVNTGTVAELKAIAQDLPMVFLNSCPDSKQLEADKYMYVGSNEEVAGQYQAQYILDKFSSKDEINVVLLRGENGHSAAASRTQAVKDVLADSGKKINYVFNDTAVWETDTAMRMFNIFLKTKQPFDCVLCNNDSMALGVIASCKQNNIDLSNLPILGVDATVDGCNAIFNKELAFTVYQSASGQGEYAIKVAKALGSGKSASKIKYISKDGKYVWVPFEKVDNSNVQNYMK
jgi:inositol transport system substrate-binding protein